MPAAIGNANPSVHHAVRELTVGYLRAEGFDVSAKRHHARLSDALADDMLAPDVEGIPGVHLAVTSRLRHRLSGDLDAARRAADINGTSVAAVLQWRAERPIADAYVLVSLADFARLVRATPPP
ncbi:hypothetical protein [Microbacterium sp. T32]|uniref:hypothetical protein n=2 Tax=Bacteria TaxID=2 RepID=UPI0007AB5C4C|nr:hypothetical protein [Microbacterium sp. T32]KZE41588.1 hypothetical protein AVW09_03110 [Microbacterium sp. T32]